MPQKNLRIILKAFVSSQFAYCPLIWMFHSMQINHKINKLHERALRIVYNHHFSSLEELLSKDKSFSVHQRILQMLATEMYKILNGLSPNNMQDIFETILVMHQHFSREVLKQLDLDYRSSLIWLQNFWTLYLKLRKEVTTLNEFKDKIKIWKL